MNAILTVFTPTYNRAYCLQRCYESLKRQSHKNFIWLIIDDGSSDNTQELVQGWVDENSLTIKYHYQKNQGMHGAHNAAYRLIDTELNVCIDSDDYMTDDAIEKIISFWEKFGDGKYSGIAALNIDTNSHVIGTRFPGNLTSSPLNKMYEQGLIKGDKKLIYRTDVMKQYPEYPLFDGEKYVSLGYKYLLADKDYELLLMNEPVCVVQYMNDGSSLNMIHQYRKNPQGFAFIRKVGMVHAFTFKRRFIEAVHYVSTSMILKNWKFICESPRKIMTLCAVPFGVMLNMYIMKTNKNTTMKNC
jgi:glycosyltransferase involved in cell wall biosynthesis